jgi:hypothetical protein
MCDETGSSPAPTVTDALPFTQKFMGRSHQPNRQLKRAGFIA